MASDFVRKWIRAVSSTGSFCTRLPSAACTFSMGPRRNRAMSTEWQPLSTMTPPPPTSLLAFHRSRMSTLPQKTFSKRMISPRMPDSTIPLALIVSAT